MSSSLTQIRSTPVKQTTPAATESPGNWRHPRLAEITRRQSRNLISERNVRQIVYNVAALVLVYLFRQAILPAVRSWALTSVVREHGALIHAAVVLVPLVNITLALLPLVRPRDDLSDIPLTPAQRKLLGLPPSSRPPTPASAYSTPPRYSRTPSLAGSPASIKSYATGSPLSNMASPAPGGGSGSGQYSSPRFGASPSKLAAAATAAAQYSPSSPSAVSPLLHKAVGGGAVAAAAMSAAFQQQQQQQRTATLPLSFGPATTSPLSASTTSSVFGGGGNDGPATPTPAAKRSSVGLNSKWLYEKGRRSSGGWLHQGLS